MKRGEVWLVGLDPTVGSEIQKMRACLIVPPDELNGILRRIIVAAMTSRSHPAPFRIATTFQRKPGLILLDEIRTVDCQRMMTRMGVVDEAALAAALTMLAVMFGVAANG